MVSKFTRLPDESYIEETPGNGWLGTSRYQHGLATGRPSPRIPSRVRPVTGLMRGREDLVTETDVAGHGHGMLFNPAPYMRNKADVLREAEVPARRTSSGEGFLPRLGNVAGTTDPAERQRITSDKVEVLKHAGTITRSVEHHGPPSEHTLGELGTSTPMRTQLQNRSSFVSPDIQGDWYKIESEQVNEAATRQGVTHGTMRRAVAIASPKTPWVRGHPQETNVEYPNMANAEAVVGHVETVRKRHEADPDLAARHGKFNPEVEALQTRVPTKSGKGEKKPAYTRVMGAIGESMTESPSTPIVTNAQIHDDPKMTGEKVPNFDLALARGVTSRTGRREAAQAYTSDVWDVRTAGLRDYPHISGGGLTKPGGTQRRPGGDLGLAANRPRGQYDVVATTGRRAGLQAGMLPSEMQQHVWRSARGAGSTAETTQQMFMPQEGYERVNKALVEQTGGRNYIIPRGSEAWKEHEAWLDKNEEF